jgi:hypothetical protein
VTPSLAAPGAAIVSISRSGKGNVTVSSPALAVGYVAGTAALVQGYRPHLSSAQVRERLIDSAGPAVAGSRTGAGVVNPVAAVSAVLPMSPASSQSSSQLSSQPSSRSSSKPSSGPGGRQPGGAPLPAGAPERDGAAGPGLPDLVRPPAHGLDTGPMVMLSALAVLALAVVLTLILVVRARAGRRRAAPEPLPAPGT